ncbi:hypothetical protein B0T14DRAFT_51031 [Immersiella caudata]|uniref:Uncharacterized protein n=1 Tax=Immersiella caudata TaxID=314043 RepID=A0AA40CD42_9PEZI|nr:hypothetical protein B0T14DRAFT_51031 [Immersiella caudata]
MEFVEISMAHLMHDGGEAPLGSLILTQISQIALASDLGMGSAEPSGRWAEVPTIRVGSGKRLHAVNGTFRMRRTPIRKRLEDVANRRRGLDLCAMEITSLERFLRGCPVGNGSWQGVTHTCGTTWVLQASQRLGITQYSNSNDDRPVRYYGIQPDARDVIMQVSRCSDLSMQNGLPGRSARQQTEPLGFHQLHLRNCKETQAQTLRLRTKSHKNIPEFLHPHP